MPPLHLSRDNIRVDGDAAIDGTDHAVDLELPSPPTVTSATWAT